MSVSEIIPLQFSHQEWIKVCICISLLSSFIGKWGRQRMDSEL